MIKVCSLCSKEWEDPSPGQWEDDRKRCADRDGCEKRAAKRVASNLSRPSYFGGYDAARAYEKAPKLGDR